MKNGSIGLAQALTIILENTKPLAVESIELAKSTDRVAASDLSALVDSPSVDSSSKDGYAVVSHEVASATTATPVRLKMAGHLAAGEKKVIELAPGTAIRVLTGARIPAGADAVVSDEFVKPDGTDILVMNFAEPDQNILLCRKPQSRQIV